MSGVLLAWPALAALAVTNEHPCADADVERSAALSVQAVEPAQPGIHWHRVGGKEHVVLVVRTREP